MEPSIYYLAGTVMAWLNSTSARFYDTAVCDNSFEERYAELIELTEEIRTIGRIAQRWLDDLYRQYEKEFGKGNTLAEDDELDVVD